MRQMALLPRFVRRSYGAGVLDALEEGQKTDKFMRAFIPGQDQPHADTGFFFLTVKIPNIELTGGYQQYRTVRVNILEAYALTLLQKNPQFRRVVGIASEPKPPAGKTPGSSEDLIYAELRSVPQLFRLSGLQEREAGAHGGEVSRAELRRRSGGAQGQGTTLLRMLELSDLPVHGEEAAEGR